MRQHPHPLFACIILLTLSRASADPSELPHASASRILSRIKVLASDEFEGRGPGTPGETKTVSYLARQFQEIGLAPGNPDGTYLQNVPLVGTTSTGTGTFVVAGKNLGFVSVNDYAIHSRRPAPAITVTDSDMIFVGYGVVAPEFAWDDYKGLDVRGKTVVMLINDPQVVDPATGQLDPNTFEGPAMTYYGRWTYKYEIASEKGAAACLIVHETGPAGYPFAVAIAGTTLESFDLKSADNNARRVPIEGWLTLGATERLFQAAGLDFAALKRQASKRAFQPVPLDAKASFSVTNRARTIESKNVVAALPGADPGLKNEWVVYSAHWDHLGRNPNLHGDQIYNGAADNATGVAMLLDIAQSFAALPAAERPKRSILFLSVTAEEKGLLGSQFYVEHPLHPLDRTVADLNIDALDANYAHGLLRDVEVVGTRRSTLDDIGAEVARRQGRVIHGDTDPGKGYYFRSDHFEFARAGVPAYFTRAGLDFVGQPEGYGRTLRDDFVRNDYHKPSDEVRPDWTCEGAAQNADFLFEIGRIVADGKSRPVWTGSGVPPPPLQAEKKPF